MASYKKTQADVSKSGLFNSSVSSGETDPPYGEEKKETSSARDPKGLLTVTTKTSSSGSGGEKASKEDWGKFLNSPAGKSYTFEKEAQKSLTQVPVKGAINVDTSTDIRDVQGVPEIKKEKPRGGSSMKSRGRVLFNIQKAFTKKNKGGSGGFCPQCIKPKK